MKITVDTLKDSEEEIKHAIAMLQTVVGKSAPSSSAILSDETPVSPMSEVYSDDNSDDRGSNTPGSDATAPGIFSLFDETRVTEVDDDEDETVIIEEDPDKDVEVQIVSYD